MNENILTESRFLKGTLSDQQIQALRSLIVNELPLIFDTFYQSIQSLAAQAIKDESLCLEIVEEYLSQSLSDALLWLGASIDSTLIRKGDPGKDVFTEVQNKEGKSKP